jgi:hypothetical protein
LLLCVLACVPRSFAGDAPQWMHALVGAPLPAHDEKTDAIELYSEVNVSVQSADKVKKTVRAAYKILRPSGREYGNVFVHFNAHEKVSGLHGWCIPAQGKDYEVKDKDGMEISLPKIEGSELVSEVKAKFLKIPLPILETLWVMSTKSKSIPSCCRTSGDFRRRFPFARAITLSSFLLAGRIVRHGSITRR